MEFYINNIYILRRFPPGKWVSLGRTVKGGSKMDNFFTGAQCHLLQILLINASILE